MNKDTTQKPFWALTEKETLEMLKSKEDGLIDVEVKKRLETFGYNLFGKKRRLAKLKILLSQFKSPLMFVLLAAGGLTLYLKEWIDAGVILLALTVNTGLGYFQENRAEEALEQLTLYIKDRARVIRAGLEREIDAELIVPGDIIHLSYGTRVPADARLLSTVDLSVDESILTGESMPVPKNLGTISEATTIPERINMIFGGTLVVGGYGTAAVTVTGKNTEIGKIAALVSETKRQKTPLQSAVSKIAWVLAALVFIIVIGIFSLGIMRGEPFFEMFLISAAVAVGSIPEALPVALTVVLAVGVERLAKRKGVVRNLAAAETLGSTTLIMTDKTGTLTKAQMELVDVATVEHILTGAMRDHKRAETLREEEKDILKLALSNVNVLIENPEDPKEKWRLVGRALETHIVKSAARHGINVPATMKEGDFYIAIPFNSKNKFSVSLIHSSKTFRYPGMGVGSFFVALGAPDVLLKKSALKKEDYVHALEVIEALSAEGKRILGVAVKHIGESKERSGQVKMSDIDGLQFVGILAFYDPIRPEVKEAMSRMEAHGVKVVMATGDLTGTAISVAEQLGWHVSSGEVLTGEEIARLTDEELLQNIHRIKIFARVTPEDKLRIGRLYKKTGEIVGMTGDGVNDAPALKSVDIGIAVGSGSDVAKDIADLVLLNDNFNTIVAAIDEGKRILGNIRKTFVYLMSSSLDEVVLIGASLLMGLPLPLTALQIIWVNFFTESIPALSFAFDNHTEKSAAPTNDKKIINTEVKFLTLGIGTLTSVLLFVLYFGLLHFKFEEPLVKTFIFACFSSYILFVAFSFRSLKQSIFSYNMFENKLLTLGVGFGIILIAATIYIPELQNIFDTTPLPPLWLLGVLGWIIINIILVELTKWIYRKT